MAMLEPQWRQPPGFMGNLSLDNADCLISELWPTLDRRTTVKDLLKIRRQMMVEDEMFLKRQALGQYLKPDVPQHTDTAVNMVATDNCENPCWSYSSQDGTMFDVEMGPTDPHLEPMDPIPHTPLYAAASTSASPASSASSAPSTPSALSVPSTPPTPSTPSMVQSEQTCLVQSMVPSEQTCPAGPSVGVPLGSSLFHWQIQEQLKRIKGVPAEVLSMRDADGDTPLHIAVAQGKRPLAYVLASVMSAAGTLDTPERNGQTALHIATATNQTLIVSDLLEHGAQVHMRDIWGRSPLHVCVEKGHAESLVAMFKTLRALGKHLDPDMVNYNGLTSLHVAVLSHNALLKQVRALGRAMGQGVDSSKERDGLLKMGQNLYKCVKALLQNGASSGAKDEKSGRTSIHMAAEEANTDLLHLLLNQSCTPTVVNLRTYSGNTALHIACALEGSKAQLDAVKMLMRRGADPGARNLENEVPYQLLPERGATDKVRQVLRGRYFHM